MAFLGSSPALDDGEAMSNLEGFRWLTVDGCQFGMVLLYQGVLQIAQFAGVVRVLVIVAENSIARMEA
jgi:hypothetical protein